MAGKPREAMLHIGGHGLWHRSNPNYRCALRGVGWGSAKGMMPGRGRRMRPSGATSGVIRPSHHAAPTRKRSAATGRDATGGKTGGGYAAAFPSLAKLGLGRQKPAVFVVGGTACLPPLRGGSDDTNIFCNNITRYRRGRLRRKSLMITRRIHSKIHALIVDENTFPGMYPHCFAESGTGSWDQHFHRMIRNCL